MVLSPYSSGKKKDGSIRIVVDYRKLNSVTIPMPFHMPSTEEIISSLGNAKVMSKLDLTKGFHQVPVEEDSRDLTTFSCKFGKFRYRRMPFGLRNAPSVFQLLMQRCLQNLERFALAYIDDVVVFLNSFDDHLNHLQLVFDRIKFD